MMTDRPSPLPPARAEEIALGAFGWLAGQDERMGTFLAAGGLDAGGLMAASADPGFLGAVLDFLLGEDAMVLDCADALGVPPQMLLRARAGLPGGETPHWT